MEIENNQYNKITLEEINQILQQQIKIETADKMGLLKDIIAAVSDNNTNIVSANVKSKEGEFGIIELGLEIDNIWTLRKVISSLQSMPDVHSVKRTQSSYIPKPNNKSKNKKPAKKV